MMHLSDDTLADKQEMRYFHKAQTYLQHAGQKIHSHRASIFVQKVLCYLLKIKPCVGVAGHLEVAELLKDGLIGCIEVSESH